ncbi:MAG TPA: EAL domain-containing protein [Thermoanaerobaculia bacterium]|nr:EAL domain-containing protein [Thermoanaerobaculia bacterium]
MKSLQYPSRTPESQLIILLDDDAMITDGLAAALERDGRTIITCNDVESAQLIIEKMKPSHVVADIHFSGPFGFEGLDFVRYAKRYSPETKIILMSGDTPEALQLEAAERGAVAFLGKPFEVRELDAMVNLMSCSASTSAAKAAKIIRMPLLDEILVSNSLNPFFQPIIALDSSSRTLGFEALARYREDSPFRNPDTLFRYAARKGRTSELELACIRRSLAAGAGFLSPAAIFLNIHPDVFNDGDSLCSTLADSAERARLPLERIVLEITEQASLPDHTAMSRTAAKLRSMGVRFALDDVGVAYSHLALIDKIRPSFLKVSQHFGTDFESDQTKLKIVMNLLSLAHEFHCELILEGIESESTAIAAADLGIEYGQGFYFGVPADAAIFRAYGGAPGSLQKQAVTLTDLVIV